MQRINSLLRHSHPDQEGTKGAQTGKEFFMEQFFFQVFDDVCSELAMAILQFFQGKPPEEQVFRCMKALNKFCTIAHRDVPQLVKMIGPEPSKFNGMSARIDEFIQNIDAKLARVQMF